MLIWQIWPNRKDTPVRINITVIAIAGIPKPARKAPHMNLGPSTNSQHTCRWKARVRMKLHITTSHPPKRRNAPEKAQERSVYIS
jgi:hypothetical protein